jgi:hypothetical protein
VYLLSRCAKVINDVVEASASRIASRASDEVASSDFLPKASPGTLEPFGSLFMIATEELRNAPICVTLLWGVMYVCVFDNKTTEHFRIPKS